MDIVSQSPRISYSLFPPVPLLAAPKIAGLLAAPTPPPQAEPFTYADPRLNDLTDDQRAKLYSAAKILFDAAIAFTLDDVNLHTLQTALVLFRRALSKQPVTPRNPAEFNAERDATVMEWLVNVDRRNQHIERDIEIIVKGEVRHD
jgi:hypothetical protein